MKDSKYSTYPIIAKDKRKDHYKDKAKAAGIVAAGGAITAGAIKGNRAIQDAGGYKAVGSKAYSAAKDAAGKSVDAARAGAGEVQNAYRRTVGTPMARDNMRTKGKIMAESVIYPVKRAAKKVIKASRSAGSDIVSGALKFKKKVGLSASEARNLINLEAKLDRALNL